jgi:hypothetical protein
LHHNLPTNLYTVHHRAAGHGAEPFGSGFDPWSLAVDSEFIPVGTGTDVDVGGDESSEDVFTMTGRGCWLPLWADFFSWCLRAWLFAKPRARHIAILGKRVPWYELGDGDIVSVSQSVESSDNHSREENKIKD